MDETVNISYADAISTMMFGFGDNQTPNPSTVRLVESVVLKQLRDILHEASKNADRRGMKTINADDLLFLMRYDRHKMQRFIKYIEYKYSVLTTINYSDTDSDKFSDATKAKRKKYENLKAIILNIDETGELLDTNEYDSIKYERMLRAERISSSLDEEKYKEYSKARQASFSSKHFANPKSFRRWVDPQNELCLSPAALEILELLAYSVVGHITDMALIIRQNSNRVRGDPLQMLSGNFFNSSMFNVPHLTDNELNVTLGQPAITVREMREVLRRYYTPQVGYMNFSNKSITGKRKLMMY